MSQAQRGRLVFLCLRLRAEPHRVEWDELIPRRFVQASPQEQMNAPDTSGAESLGPQIVVEVGDRLFSQVSQFDASDAGEDVAVD